MQLLMLVSDFSRVAHVSRPEDGLAYPRLPEQDAVRMSSAVLWVTGPQWRLLWRSFIDRHRSPTLPHRWM